jgi:hypothetical protein
MSARARFGKRTSADEVLRERHRRRPGEAKPSPRLAAALRRPHDGREPVTAGDFRYII